MGQLEKTRGKTPGTEVWPCNNKHQAGAARFRGSLSLSHRNSHLTESVCWGWDSWAERRLKDPLAAEGCQAQLCCQDMVLGCGWRNTCLVSIEAVGWGCYWMWALIRERFVKGKNLLIYPKYSLQLICHKETKFHYNRFVSPAMFTKHPQGELANTQQPICLIVLRSNYSP